MTRGYLLVTVGYQYDDEGMTAEDGGTGSTVYLDQKQAQVACDAQNIHSVLGLDQYEWSNYFWYPAQYDELEESQQLYNKLTKQYNAEGTEWEDATDGDVSLDFTKWSVEAVLEWYYTLPFEFYRIETVDIV